MYYIYFAISEKSKKCYVGYTSKSPMERVLEHNRGSNKWSTLNKPLKLIYYESYLCKEDALLREKFYKSGVGKKVKRAILNEFSKDG